MQRVAEGVDGMAAGCCTSVRNDLAGAVLL